MQRAWTNRGRCAPVGMIACGLAASGAYAQTSIPPSGGDVFDMTQGTVVTSATGGISPGPEPAMSLTGGGPEPGRCFFPNLSKGGVGFIEITTSAVALTSVRLYGGNDGAGTGFRRTMEGFRLFADTDGDGIFETTVVDAAINPDYAAEPRNLATHPQMLEIEFQFGSVTSSRWRFEFVQGATSHIWAGIRLIEVDGYGDLPCYADCDSSTGVGVLDIFDFLCFQNSFVNAEPYACDCDTTTGSLVCDIFDFLCFQNAFVGGCP